MKVPCLTLVLALLLSSGLPLAALDTNDNTLVTITNRLQDKDLVYLFTSPSDSEYWSADILAAKQALKAGTKAIWEAYYPDHSAGFDLLAIDQSGGVYKVKNLVLSDGAPGNVVIDNSCRISRNEADFRLVEVNFENRTGKALEYLFFAPKDSKSWGFDLLDEKTSLAAGAALPFYLPLGTVNFEMELLAIDVDGKEFSASLGIKTTDEGIKIIIGPAMSAN